MTIHPVDKIRELVYYIGKRAEKAYIDIKLEEKSGDQFQSAGRNGEIDSYLVKQTAEYVSPTTFLRLLNPPETDTSAESPNSWLNWNRAKDVTAAKDARKAWEKIQNNRTPSPEDQKIRHEQYIDIEEANREDVGILPIHHEIEEGFTYEWAWAPRTGSMGDEHKKMHKARILDVPENPRVEN